MKKSLNNKQRKFLLYLKNNHSGLGDSDTIDSILLKGSYTMTNIAPILWDWDVMISFPKSPKEIERQMEAIVLFGSPLFKYLKKGYIKV